MSLHGDPEMARAPKGVLRKSKFPLVIKKKSLFGTSLIRKSMKGGNESVSTARKEDRKKSAWTSRPRPPSAPRLRHDVQPIEIPSPMSWSGRASPPMNSNPIGLGTFGSSGADHDREQEEDEGWGLLKLLGLGDEPETAYIKNDDDTNESDDTSDCSDGSTLVSVEDWERENDETSTLVSDITNPTFGTQPHQQELAVHGYDVLDDLEMGGGGRG